MPVDTCSEDCPNEATCDLWGATWDKCDFVQGEVCDIGNYDFDALCPPDECSRGGEAEYILPLESNSSQDFSKSK